MVGTLTNTAYTLFVNTFIFKMDNNQESTVACQLNFYVLPTFTSTYFVY